MLMQHWDCYILSISMSLYVTFITQNTFLPCSSFRLRPKFKITSNAYSNQPIIQQIFLYKARKGFRKRKQMWLKFKTQIYVPFHFLNDTIKQFTFRWEQINHLLPVRTVWNVAPAFQLIYLLLHTPY